MRERKLKRKTQNFKLLEYCLAFHEEIFFSSIFEAFASFQAFDIKRITST